MQLKGPTFGVRHVQYLFLFFIDMIIYSSRFGFSVALVAMTQNYSSNPDVPYYNWTNKSFILSTFFWGYVITQIPVGILGTKFGSKFFILVAVLINSLCMIVIPTVAATLGSTGVMVCRIIQGCSQGIIVPSTHGIIGKWAVPNERSRVYAFMITGAYVGNALGLSTTGVICASWAGWPLSFYLIPSTGFLWALLYFFYGSASPSSHKTITDEERNFIQTTLESQDIHNVPIPYKAILTSKPVWAILIMALCSGWGFSIFTTELPIYMDKVMKFNIESNGLLSALPSIFNLISINIVAMIADFLIKNKHLSIRNVRKLMSSLGSITCAILLAIFVYMPAEYTTLGMVIFIAAAIFRSMNGGGYNINHVDLAPNFAATLMGLVNTSSEIFSFVTPIAVQYIVIDESDRDLWLIVFIAAICLYIFSSCFYIIFAEGDVQSWNHIAVESQNKTKEVEE